MIPRTVHVIKAITNVATRPTMTFVDVRTKMTRAKDIPIAIPVNAFRTRI
jgi:hypothetical protein